MIIILSFRKKSIIKFISITKNKFKYYQKLKLKYFDYFNHRCNYNFDSKNLYNEKLSFVDNFFFFFIL